MSSQHNVGAYHRPGEAHTWCQFSLLGSIHCRGLIWQLQLFPIQETFQLDLLVVTKLFLLIEVFFLLFFFFSFSVPPPPFHLSLPSLIVTPSVCASVCLFGSHGKRRGKWFSVASDFHYLFSIRPTYLWKKKQHVERKWQAEIQPH